MLTKINGTVKLSSRSRRQIPEYTCFFMFFMRTDIITQKRRSYVLLYPGWSKSWHTAAVIKMPRSVSARFSYGPNTHTHMHRFPLLLLHSNCCTNCYVPKSSHLEVAEVDHAVHHLTHAETMTEIMERVASVIFLNAQLRTYKKDWGSSEMLNWKLYIFHNSAQLYSFSYQPAFKSNRVYVKLLHEA